MLTVDHTQVGGSTLSNFGVLISATVGSSRIQNSNCFDVIFTSDSTGATKIPWEMETCTQASGAMIAWAALASISPSADAIFYVSYGNASISTAQNTGGVAPSNIWDTNYKGVWHLGNGSTLSATDSTSNANNGSISSATATTGEIDGAAATTGGSDVSLPFPALNNAGSAWTLSVWLEQTNSASFNSAFESADGSRSIAAFVNGGGLSVTSGVLANMTLGCNLSLSSPHYMVVTQVSGTLTLYCDNTNEGTASNSNSMAAQNVVFGANPSGGGSNWVGFYDEVRVSSGIARASNWIAAEYLNQKPGSSFLTMGSEQ